MSKLKFKEVDESNIHDIVHIEVNSNQKNFIESTKKCLYDAYQEKGIWKVVGIYDEDLLVGFAMYGLYPLPKPDGQVWLDRFLIDRHYQHHGYGKRALYDILDLLKETYHYNDVYLSVYDDNEVAIKLYKEIGFKFNGELDINGEKVMVYHYENN